MYNQIGKIYHFTKIYSSEFGEDQIGSVRTNSILDSYSNFCWNARKVGYHKGLEVHNGKYVLIEKYDKNIRYKAYAIEPIRALMEILESDNIDLLEMKKFSELKNLYMSIDEDIPF